MVKYALPNGTGGLDQVLVDLAKNTGGTASPVPVIPLILTFIWLFVFIGGSMAQNRKSGNIDTPVWATFASLSTFMLALIFSLLSGIISLPVLSITLGLTILSAVWLFTTKERF